MFGVDWLRWWQADRDPNFNREKSIGDLSQGEYFLEIEKDYLELFKENAIKGVATYCYENNIRVPNRCTTVQPAGSKSLLTGASPGWHPPKAAWFIRRITFQKNDPVALACIDYGYKVIPSQSDKDKNGVLLDDPFDSRCTEWLVEIPVKTSWADLEGVSEIDISKFSVKAQYNFYMQVQKYYTTHNTSSTLEFRENEIEELSNLIFNSINKDEGYISSALLAKFDASETFPRLPFEPINSETYNKLNSEVLERRLDSDFHKLLMKYDVSVGAMEGPTGCDSDKCMLPLAKS